MSEYPPPITSHRQRTRLIQRVAVLLEQNDHLAERVPHGRNDLVTRADRVNVGQHLTASET